MIEAGQLGTVLLARLLTYLRRLDQTMKTDDFDFERFAKVSISLSLLLPQDYVAMAGTGLVGELAATAAAGRLPVQMNISLATAGNVTAVPEAIREAWLERIAADEERLTSVRKMADDLDVDEEGKLQKRFLVWPMGTPVGDVNDWLDEVKR